jgi:mycothiol synthase
VKPAYRSYQIEDDFWRMREFLREVLLLNGRREHSWHVARLDYARWHGCMNCSKQRMEDVVFLWEVNEKIVSFIMAEGGYGNAHFSVHPSFSNLELEEEMFTVAEKNLANINENQKRSLEIWAPDVNKLRQEIANQRGYNKADCLEQQWRRELKEPIPDIPLAPGFTIRALGNDAELLERCYASGLGFHEGDIKIAAENRSDPTWYRNIQTAPLYRRDLDLVAVSTTGAIAAFCTIWFDDVTRTAYYEPVATVPEYRKLGLGKTLLTEGLKRLQRMGALVAFVGGSSPHANALYQSVMGPNFDLYESWVKTW